MDESIDTTSDVIKIYEKFDIKFFNEKFLLKLLKLVVAHPKNKIIKATEIFVFVCDNKFEDDVIEKVLFKDISSVICSDNFKEIFNVFERIDISSSDTNANNLWENIKDLKDSSFFEACKKLNNGLHILSLSKLSISNEIVLDLYDRLFSYQTTENTEVSRYKTLFTRKQAYEILMKNKVIVINRILKNHDQYYESFKNIPKNPLNYTKRLKTQNVGIKKFGCTCYVNSVIQVLFSVKNFRSTILSSQISFLVSTNLGYIFGKLKYSILSSVRTHAFIRNFLDYEDNPINPFEQMDAEEFLIRLFDKLEDEQGKNVQTEFAGTQTRRIICKQCKSLSDRQENMLTLGLEVSNNKNIDDCFKKLFQPEELSGDNKYNCEYCKSKQDATKTLIIKTLPNYLFITLKIFQYSHEEGQMVLIDNKCEVDKEIKLKSDQNEPIDYVLQAIILHIGNSQAGHYIAFIRKKNNWIRLNDEVIDYIPESLFNINNLENHVDHKLENARLSPYILLYKRKNMMKNSFDFTYRNFANLEKIYSKNNLVSLTNHYLGKDFVYFFTLLIETSHVCEFLNIVFTTFFHSDIDIKSMIELIEKIVKRIESLDNELTEKVFVFLNQNFHKVLFALTDNLPTEALLLAGFLVKRIVQRMNSEQVYEFLSKFFVIYKLDHLSHNFTPIINLFVFSFSKSDKFYQAGVTSLLYYVFQAKPVDETAGSYLGLKKNFTNPTDFALFYDYLYSQEALLNFGEISNCFSEVYLSFIINTIRKPAQLDIISRIISYYYSELSVIDMISQKLLSAQINTKLKLLLNYYENIKNKNIQVEHKINENLIPLINESQLNDFKDIICFT